MSIQKKKQLYCSYILHNSFSLNFECKKWKFLNMPQVKYLKIINKRIPDLLRSLLRYKLNSDISSKVNVIKQKSQTNNTELQLFCTIPSPIINFQIKLVVVTVKFHQSKPGVTNSSFLMRQIFGQFNL